MWCQVPGAPNLLQKAPIPPKNGLPKRGISSDLIFFLKLTCLDTARGDKNCECLGINRNLCCFPPHCDPLQDVYFCCRSIQTRRDCGKRWVWPQNPFEKYLPPLLAFPEQPKEAMAVVIQMKKLLFFLQPSRVLWAPATSLDPKSPCTHP